MKACGIPFPNLGKGECQDKIADRFKELLHGYHEANLYTIYYLNDYL